MVRPGNFRLAILVLILLVMIFPITGHAEVKEIIAEGTYVMGDGETPSIADERALLDAKRNAIEQAGTYVESYSATKNYQLTTDEVKTIASGIMDVTILDKSRTVVGNSINFWVKIKAVVTTDKIEDMAAKLKDASMADDYGKLQQEYDKSQAEIAALKQQLAQANTDNDRTQIRDQIANNETGLRANTWLGQGNQLMQEHRYSEAIDAFTTAINYKPGYLQAYFRRGAAYAAIREYQEAMTDFDRMLDINSQSALAYYGKGVVYERLRDRSAAIAAYRRVVDYASPKQEALIERAHRRIQVLTESGEVVMRERVIYRGSSPKLIIVRRSGE